MAVTLAAFVLALLLGRALSRPIRHLAAAATNIRDLDFSGPPVGYRDLLREHSLAASAFNAMVHRPRSFETYVPRSLVCRLVHRQGEGARAARCRGSETRSGHCCSPCKRSRNDNRGRLAAYPAIALGDRLKDSCPVAPALAC